LPLEAGQAGSGNKKVKEGTTKEIPGKDGRIKITLGVKKLRLRLTLQSP
jgi:hypothetical protein